MTDIGANRNRTVPNQTNNFFLRLVHNSPNAMREVSAL